ncbi:MAG: DUF547 domain-containing protein [Abyssibacter sp.]|uniref:DUF547 domain-containing protein n=1 Tax=Abyssibacter sp. TaxID=2320200 RepID=UPI00321C1A1E
MSVHNAQPIAWLSLLLGLLWAGTAQAAPKADLWPFWAEHDAESALSVDHSAWTDWLQRFVQVRRSGANRVDYGAVDPAGREQLDRYINGLVAMDPRRLTRAEQKAYWINLYNAITVQLILQAYPVDSIRQIKSGFFSAGPWGKTVATVAGQALTLNDIEHRILRPIWQDPLIHYGVNCASMGCPDLRPRAYTAARVDQQLADNARAFVNDARGVQVDGRRLQVSSIYVWFKDDFDGSDAGVIRHLRAYSEPDLRDALDALDEIDDHDYDWSLNDAS